MSDVPIRYNVYSLDMWGHVPADCSAEYGCDCVKASNHGDDPPEHDDNACTCSEDCNDRHKVGTLDVPDGMKDAEIIAALHAEGFLTDKGKDVATVDVATDGSMLDIVDAEGRRLFSLETEEPF